MLEASEGTVRDYLGRDGFVEENRESEGPVAVYDGDFVWVNEEESYGLVSSALEHLADESRRNDLGEDGLPVNLPDPEAVEGAANALRAVGSAERFSYEDGTVNVYSMPAERLTELGIGDSITTTDDIDI
jgi:hypothetical protein